MGIRSSHNHGSFSWVDLATTDQDGAKKFYSELFGWTFKENPMGEDDFYSMIFHKEKAVAAIFTQPPEMREKNIPPHWQNYITVDNVDLMTENWKSHGGEILMPPFDVMESGRMTTLQDPTGATLNLWQPKEHIGAEIVNERNTLCWNELNTRDVNKAKDFFKKVFQWSYDEIENTKDYLYIKNNERYNGGILDMHKYEYSEKIPPHWNPYFNVEDIDKTIEKAKELGGQVRVPKSDFPSGPYSVLVDPQGASFSVIQLQNFDD